jgi:hypothetical protein
MLKFDSRHHTQILYRRKRGNAHRGTKKTTNKMMICCVLAHFVGIHALQADSADVSRACLLYEHGHAVISTL